MDLSRRDLLQWGAGLGASSLALGSLGAGTIASKSAPAKSLIQIWLWGGSCHLDTFDPKPDSGSDYSGPYTKPIGTKAGFQICEKLPLLAKQSNHYSLVRSLTHGVNGHETASYLVQTGHFPGKDVYPGVGAVLAHRHRQTVKNPSIIPPYIVMTKGQGRFSEAGFLGSSAKPFITGGDPDAKVFAVEGVVTKGLSRDRQVSRRNLLEGLDKFEGRFGSYGNLSQATEARDKAYELILGDAGKVFDLNLEKSELRDEYGRNSFGQACLAARRLVEIGTPVITINFQGWDTHKKHFESMSTKLPELDQGLATLIRDLKERGLLDTTLVWCSGEFGRKPKIDHRPPWNGGRSHFGNAFSGLLAGGGLQGGQVVGSTDEKGMEVKERPVYPWDMTSTIYRQFGVNSTETLLHPQGHRLPLIPPEDEKHKYGGLLDELV